MDSHIDIMSSVYMYTLQLYYYYTVYYFLRHIHCQTSQFELTECRHHQRLQILLHTDNNKRVHYIYVHLTKTFTHSHLTAHALLYMLMNSPRPMVFCSIFFFEHIVTVIYTGRDQSQVYFLYTKAIMSCWHTEF